MNVYELIMKRRSARNFKDQEIPENVIEQLLDAANNAPSGGNIQPISIILVQEAEWPSGWLTYKTWIQNDHAQLSPIKEY